VAIRCACDRIPDVLWVLRDGPVPFDYFTFMTAVDRPAPEDPASARMDLHYHLRSTNARMAALVTAEVPRDGATAPSVCDLYEGARWHERECYDLLGVTFSGHPSLSRILLPDDWEGHPLRKDYREEDNEVTYTPEKRRPEFQADRLPEPPPQAPKPAAGKKDQPTD
jgi:NADH-quinone oxidoreductase subunit C